MENSPERNDVYIVSVKKKLPFGVKLIIFFRAILVALYFFAGVVSVLLAGLDDGYRGGMSFLLPFIFLASIGLISVASFFGLIYRKNWARQIIILLDFVTILWLLYGLQIEVIGTRIGIIVLVLLGFCEIFYLYKKREFFS